MPTYAKETSVSPDRSRAEIEQTLARYGATQFMYGWNGHAAVIAFEMHDRRLRFVLPLPARDDPAFAQTPTGRRRTQAQIDKAYDQAVRKRWRVGGDELEVAGHGLALGAVIEMDLLVAWHGRLLVRI